MRRGVKTWLTTPSYASAHYTKDYDPELAAKALAPYARRHDRARRHLPDVLSRWSITCEAPLLRMRRFVDASDMVDRIKVIKSAGGDGAGQARARDAGRRHARGVRRGRSPACATPTSRRSRSATASATAARTASISAPRCRSARRRNSANRHLQNRVIQKGDQIALLVEDNGPGRHVHRARPLLRGRRKVPQAMKDEFAFCWRRASLPSTCSSRARPARTSGTRSTPSCARTAGRWRRGSTATARATTWSSGR